MGGSMSYWMSQDPMMLLFLWGPPLLLAAVCVLTLNTLPPQRRRGLFALCFILLGLAAVLFGGAWMLGRWGLAWRIWFQEGLSVCLWLVGLTTGNLRLRSSFLDEVTIDTG